MAKGTHMVAFGFQPELIFKYVKPGEIVTKGPTSGQMGNLRLMACSQIMNLVVIHFRIIPSSRERERLPTRPQCGQGPLQLQDQ